MSEPVILLVEQDTRTLELLHAILRRFHPGIRILTSDSAEKAIGLLDSNPVDLVACDCPEGAHDDRWLAAQVRSTRHRSEVPILFMGRSRNAPEQLAEREHHLAKPFSALALVDKIDDILASPDGSDVVKSLRSGSQSGPLLAPGTGGEPPPTTIIRTKFAEVMEGIKVRITQLVSPPVPDDLIKRHLLFSRAIETYRIQEHFLRSGSEVLFHVFPSAAMAGYNELRFEIVVKSAQGGAPDRRQPVMPDFLLARDKSEVTVEGEIDRVTRFVQARYLAEDVDLPPDTLLGHEFQLEAVAFPDGWAPSGTDSEVDLTVRLAMTENRPDSLRAYWERVLEEIRAEGATRARIKKVLIEALLGLEDLAHRVDSARNRLSKAALYLSALVLVLQDHWQADYERGRSAAVTWDGDDQRLEGLAGGTGRITFDDPIGRIVFDEGQWFELMDAYSHGDKRSQFRVMGVRARGAANA